MSMTLIETIELGSSQASITFSSIPQDYTDLMILLSGRSDHTGSTRRDVLLQLNSESSSSVSLRGNGSAAGSPSNTNGTIGEIGTSDTTANTFNNLSAYISNYTSTSDKSVSTDSVYENNATAAGQHISALLSTSTGATTQITLTLESGNFVTGTTAYLYGITAGSGGATVS